MLKFIRFIKFKILASSPFGYPNGNFFTKDTLRPDETADNLPYEKVGNNEPVCIADEVPFDIPDTWEWVRFSSVVNYSIGKTPQRKATEYWNNPTHSWVSIADMVTDGHISKTKEGVNDYASDKIFKGKKSPAGTLLMSFKLTVGKVSLLDIDAFHNEAIISIYPFVDDDKTMTSYLFAVMPLLSKLGETKTAIKGNTLNSDSLDNLWIPLPPFNEQKRICAKLNDLIPFIDKYGKYAQEVSTLRTSFPEQLKKSILQEAVQGKLVPQDPNDEPASVLLERIRAEKQALIKAGKIKKDKNESVIFRRDNSHYEKLNGIEHCIDDEIPFEIPENWCWCRLGTIASILGGKRIPAGRKLSNENTGYTYIRVSDMKDGFVSTEDLHYVPKDIYPSISKYIIKKEDVFITVAGTIGRVGKIPPELDGANLTENADRLVFTTIDQEWLIKELQSNLIQSQIAEATTKVGQPKLAITRIEKLLIALPPLNEQHRIVSVYNSILPMIEQL